MKGVTQSYNMFDTHLYKSASKMREKIMNENMKRKSSVSNFNSNDAIVSQGSFNLYQAD